MVEETSGNDELVFLPLGGSGEIGMNLNLFGYGPVDDRQWVMVDLGVTFGDARTPGIDVIMPDPEYILEYKKDLLGLVLTHGHEDHIGAVVHLWPLLQCPIYATPFTAELLRGKFAETDMDIDRVMEIVPLGGSISLGPFHMDLITLTHSIPEPNALAIRTPLGTILHTGDWKIDPGPLVGELTDETALRQIGDEGVLAMVCDSTNVFEPGRAGSEEDVRASLITLLGELKGRVAITCFASNVARLETTAIAAKANNRHVCLVGRSMYRMLAASREVGLLGALDNIVSEEEAGYLPPDKVLYVCTGSQGEPRAALSRIASNQHPHVVLSEGDTVIFSSRVIPGNEISIYELQNQLAELGIRIITDRDHFIHVSGHPCRDELADMYNWVRPKIAVPVHGEARHLLEHSAFAKSLQIPETIVPKNGTMVRLAPGDAEIIDEVPTGRLYLDGNILVREGESHLRERRKISFVGQVMVSLALDKKGRLLADPQVRLQGVPSFTALDGELLEDILEDEVLFAADNLNSRQIRDDGLIEQAMKRAVRQTLGRYWGKKTIVDVIVLRS